MNGLRLPLSSLFELGSIAVISKPNSPASEEINAPEFKDPEFEAEALPFPCARCSSNVLDANEPASSRPGMSLKKSAAAVSSNDEARSWNDEARSSNEAGVC